MRDLRTEVLNGLHWNLAIPRHAVAVAVEGGWVTLQGDVNRTYQRSFAEAEARRIPGVLGVRNDIVVQRGDADRQTVQGATRDARVIG